MKRPSISADDDEGTAVIEFVVLVVLIIVPVMYAVLAAMQVQAAAFGVTQAAREAGRAFVQADSTPQAQARARAAASLALTDQGVTAPPAVTITCSDVCLRPGSTATIRVSTRVRLPFLPDSLAETTVGAVPVSAEFLAPVDEYREWQ